MSDELYNPPFTVTENIINLTASISELVGRISIDFEQKINPKLRRDNRLKTIHASLAIENNSLSLGQVTDVINGKRVLGPPGDIQEVKNAYEAYETLLSYNPYACKDLLLAHRLLMHGLVSEAGNFRSGGVGIFAGKQLVHMAPPAKLVPEQVNKLLEWSKRTKTHTLIKSCVFHYEFEFIHPFADGNGRMGRMWQTLLLYKWNPIFAWLPVETLIREHQDEYYAALGRADAASDSGVFIDFLLRLMEDSLKEMSATAQVNAQVTAQVYSLLESIGDKEFSLMELMEKLQLRHRQNFRKLYLLPAIEAGLVEMTVPDKPNSSKQKYRRTDIK